MKQQYPHKNTLEKARIVKELVDKHYEPGRQDRCKLWVYRNVVRKVYPMSKGTFFRYLAIINEQKEKSYETTID